MNKIIGLTLALFFALALFDIGNAHPTALTTQQEEARAVLESFLDAHLVGDTGLIKECLGGRLLTKRLRLLNNPEYSAFLAKYYQDARFEILRYKTKGKRRIQIDVKIGLYGDESQKMRYLLIKKRATASDPVPRFRIYSRKEITDESLRVGN